MRPAVAQNHYLAGWIVRLRVHQNDWQAKLRIPMKDGDVVEVEFERIGVLRNPVKRLKK